MTKHLSEADHYHVGRSVEGSLHYAAVLANIVQKEANILVYAAASIFISLLKVENYAISGSRYWADRMHTCLIKNSQSYSFPL